MIRCSRNDYEPDLCFFKHEKSQHIQPDQTLFPPPDFIIEILSPSTEKYDRGIKFQDYAAHDVKEYWIIDPDQESIEQYILENDKYHLHLKAKTGEITSQVIKNFTIPIRSLFDESYTIKVLKQLIKDNQ